MRNTVLVVWTCLWAGQCLCHWFPPQPADPSPPPHTWRPSYQHNVISQTPSTQHSVTTHMHSLPNNTPMRRRTSPKPIPHPVPGITDSTHHNAENIFQPVTMDNTNKVPHTTSRNYTREHRVTSSVLPPITTTKTPIHTTREHFSTVDDFTTDEESREGPKEDPHSNHNHESYTRSSISFMPAPEDTPMDLASSLFTPQDSPATENTEGAGREGHGRVTTRPNDLCSYCLCDAVKKNVYCQHEHTNHETIHELLLDDQIIPRSAVTLRVAGFERVVVKSNTFSKEDLRLRKIIFEGIKHLELVTHSLRFNEKAKQNMEVAILFNNCYIPNLPLQTLTQLTRSDDPKQDINLEETRFLTLKFEGCNIGTMHSYALFNARIIHFNMTGTKVEMMEENSVHLDSYDGWIIEKSQLPNLVQKSICLRPQNYVIFSHNTFLGLGNRSLDILSSSQVRFEFNEVLHLRSGALLGIRPHKEAQAVNIVFLNNTIVEADEHSLLTSMQYPMHERTIINNKFNIPCDCNVITTFKKLLGINSSSGHESLEIFETVIKKSLCHVSASTRSYALVYKYKTRNCTLPITMIVAGTCMGVAILLLVIVSVICSRRVKKAREEANYLGECCFSQSFSTLHSNTHVPMSPMNGHSNQSWEPTTPLQPWVVAVPEVKTYKETELNVSFEHTEPMKVSLRDSFCPEPGPLLDLQRNTQSMTTSKLFHSTREITIKNCNHLAVTHGSFKSGPLTVIFQNIQKLSLAAGSFEVGNNGRINITISNSTLSEIPSDMFNTTHPIVREPSRPSGVASATHELVFHVAGSEIGRIAPRAFARCTLHRLTITNTTLSHVDTGAIHNQVQDAISFINNTFVSLGKQAVAFFSSHTNTKLRLDGNIFQGNVPLFLEGNITGDVDINNNSFPRLESSPWKLRVQGDVLLKGNTFASLPRHGLDFTVHHRISLVENNIQHLGPEAFLLIIPQGKKTILFMDGNLIHQLEPMSLCLNEAFSPNSIFIKHARFQQKCECNITATLSQALDIKDLTIQAIYENGVQEQWFKNGECVLKSQGISHIFIDQFLIHSCLPHNDTTKDSARLLAHGWQCSPRIGPIKRLKYTLFLTRLRK
ncbi:uncharacterized protein LOC123514290 isoform X2 [Portunus trituberculatus]|uniref:uncharacterized protein LOC123514290 isoform X2 n=1 Tax=Portunus trituberculatus TaxID=210409 RepID=UPI001E1CC593|nr:uncharacterized protein LOC123514290 isoform X2 [Portunus trituberculatus]